MPPRYAYWTILIDGTATAFRAKDKEELLPTLTQLRRTNKHVEMKWFARGRLWDQPEQAQWAGKNLPAAREKRGADWRPGGAHKDPRARFNKPREKPRDTHEKRGDRRTDHRRPDARGAHAKHAGFSRGQRDRRDQRSQRDQRDQRGPREKRGPRDQRAPRAAHGQRDQRAQGPRGSKPPAGNRPPWSRPKGPRPPRPFDSRNRSNRRGQEETPAWNPQKAVPPPKRDQSPDKPPAPEQIATPPKPPERG